MDYATMLACAAALALIVYRYDMYEKEPWYLLLLVLLLGMVTGRGVGLLEDMVIAPDASIGRQAMIAAVFEETTKLLIVLVVAVLFRKYFNDPIDGLIYGAFAGLGSAMVESLFYIGDSTSQSGIAAQEAVRLLLHLLMGGLAGFGLGMARFRMRFWPMVLGGWVAAAMTIHYFWDSICGLPAPDDIEPAHQRIVAVGLMLVATGMFGVSVFMGARWSRAIHAPKSRKRLWGWPFSLLFRRRR